MRWFACYYQVRPWFTFLISFYIFGVHAKAQKSLGSSLGNIFADLILGRDMQISGRSPCRCVQKAQISISAELNFCLFNCSVYIIVTFFSIIILIGFFPYSSSSFLGRILRKERDNNSGNFSYMYYKYKSRENIFLREQCNILYVSYFIDYALVSLDKYRPKVFQSTQLSGFRPPPSSLRSFV